MNFSHSQKDRNIELLKQMNKISQNMNQISNNSNKALYQNKQKLENIDKKLDKINGTLDQSKETAKEISSFWYYLKNKVKKAIGLKKQTKVSEQVENQREQNIFKAEKDITFDKRTNQIKKQIQQDQQQKMANLLLQNIKQVKYSYKMMGQQLDYQNSLIEKVAGKVDLSINKTQKVNKILKKELNH